MILSLTLVVTLTIGGSIAYLTSEDSDVNVMTLGNVTIEQLEYERVVDENGNWISTGETDKYGYIPDKVQEFKNDKPLYPAVFADGAIKWDDRVSGHQQSWGEVGASGSNQLFDDSVKNAQDKFVFVKNTGKSDAYVRTWVALEQGSVAEENFKKVIMTNTNADHWNWESIPTQYDVVIDGNEYVVLCAVYNGPKSNPTGILAPGAVSYPSLLQIYMKPEATNDDVAAIDGDKNGVYSILTFSQAVQAEGFADAKTALDEAFGTDHPWVDVELDIPTGEDEEEQPANGDDPSKTYPAPEGAKEVNGTAELLAALAQGETTLLLKNGEYEWTGNAGHGKTLNLYGESKDAILYITNEAPDSEAADYSFHSSNVTFNGLTISSSKYVAPKNNYPGFGYMSATYNDCVIDQTYVLYKGPQVFNYCTLNVSGDKYNIWTWGGEDITFNYCTFNCDGKAILLYNGPTTALKVKDCVFNDNGSISGKAAIEIGQDYGGRKYTVEVVNTTVNGFDINPNGTSTGSTLWGNKNSMTPEQLSVTVDGVKVY